MRAEENPCYKCTKRKVGCHSTCKEHKDYLDKFHAEQKAFNRARRKCMEINTYNRHKTRRLKGWSEE